MDKNKIINIATNNPEGLWVHKYRYRTEKLRKKCLALVKQGVLVRDLEKQFDSRKHYIFSVRKKKKLLDYCLIYCYNNRR